MNRLIDAGEYAISSGAIIVAAMLILWATWGGR